MPETSLTTPFLVIALRNANSDNLYKHSASGIIMKCITLEEGKDILREIHEGVCGNHAASRTLVGKAYILGFF